MLLEQVARSSISDDSEQKFIRFRQWQWISYGRLCADTLAYDYNDAAKDTKMTFW